MATENPEDEVINRSVQQETPREVSLEEMRSGGEKFEATWLSTWVEPETSPPNTNWAQASVATKDGREFAALHLIQGDLEFALECFMHAEKMGIPDVSNALSRALINSGVISYARPFKTTVRDVRLSSERFLSLGPAFDVELHDYLIALRDKHIAHSVNGLERCESVVTMGQMGGEGPWRPIGGIGVIVAQHVGMPQRFVRAAGNQIAAMRDMIAKEIDERRGPLYAGFNRQFALDGKWEWSAMVQLPDRRAVAQRRK